MTIKKADLGRPAVPQKDKAEPVRLEDEAALRQALEDARQQVKQRARREVESDAGSEEILHFRLKNK